MLYGQGSMLYGNVSSIRLPHAEIDRTIHRQWRMI